MTVIIPLKKSNMKKILSICGEEESRVLKDPFRKMNKHKLNGMDPALSFTMHKDKRMVAFGKLSSLNRRTTLIQNIAGFPVAKIIGPYTRLDYFAMKGDSCKMRIHLLREIIKQKNPLVLELPLGEDSHKLLSPLNTRGYFHATSKVTAFADVIGVFVKAGPNVIFNLNEPEAFYPDRLDCFPISISDSFKKDARKLAKQVSELQGANHWSNYNKGNSWSALSLRGYGDERFIIKPSSMPRKWKKENENLLDAKCKDTPLMKKFPLVQRLCNSIPGKKDRIRFMFLTPGGGELGRHTDKMGKEVKFAKKGIARLHIPLVTNNKVWFTTWDMEGGKQKHHMEAGKLYYLEIHKPHQAVNNGKSVRVHLVIDTIIEEDLYKLLLESYGKHSGILDG